MKTLTQDESIPVPKGIKITIKSKMVTVEGKHGKLSRNFKHLPLELWLGDSGKKVCARMFFCQDQADQLLAFRVQPHPEFV